jgi:hypothetical protein
MGVCYNEYMPTSYQPGDLVRVHTTHGERFGRVVLVGHKYIHVRVAGKVIKPEHAKVTPWPPAREDGSAPAAPISPARRARTVRAAL